MFTIGVSLSLRDIQKPRAARALGDPRDSENFSARSIADRYLSSTVAVYCDSSVGSGFFVSSTRVITNAHVVCPEGADMHVVLSDGTKLDASLVEKHQEVDLALLDVPDADATPVALGDSGSVHTGDPIVVMGAPRGLEFSVSKGIVSQAERRLLGTCYLQIDAPVNPGNSGGPIFDAHGKVVGIVTLKVAAGDGMAMALPINYATLGDNALVDEPVPAPNQERWEALLHEAEDEDSDEQAKLKSALSSGMLVVAKLMARDRVMVLMLQQSVHEPSLTSIRLTADRNGERVCSPEATLHGWNAYKPGDGSAPTGSISVDWLEKRQLTRDLWMGTASFAWYPECAEAPEPRGVSLVFDDGVEPYNRAVVY